MNIIGLSAFYHEAACCLLQNGKLTAAAEEERFTRIKHDPAFPVNAFRFCLDAARITITDVDCVAWYELPVRKLSRQIWSGSRLQAELPWLDSGRVHRDIRETLGFEGPIHTFPHHESHAASAFFCSGFEEAALLTVDGVGEWATTAFGRAYGSAVDLFEEVEFPNSLGLLYSTITAYLGFGVNSGEYKVMGLAPYGKPRFADALRLVVHNEPGGQYRLDPRYFDFLRGNCMFSGAMAELLGGPPRPAESEITQFHKDVASSLQCVLEEILLDKVAWLHSQAPSENLCTAGGVALNCVANGRILREGPFRRLFVQPSAGDAGGCIGAAWLAHCLLTGSRPQPEPLRSACLGPAFSSDEISALLQSLGLDGVDFRGREPDLFEAIVDRLSSGKAVGFFHGRMEFGPRALGARSILADPRDPNMRDRLNRLVKKREAFRPFAPSVLAGEARAHFQLDHPSPFMLETCQVASPLDLPAITHVDGSARPQTVDPDYSPRFAGLISAFHRRTGCPVLVNTSFNVRDEPIVNTPLDALRCLVHSGIDSLALEDFLIDREMVPDRLAYLLGSGPQQTRTEPLSAVLYTFL